MTSYNNKKNMYINDWIKTSTKLNVKRKHFNNYKI